MKLDLLILIFIILILLIASAVHMNFLKKQISAQQQIIEKQDAVILKSAEIKDLQDEYIKKLESINEELKVNTEEIRGDLKVIAEWLGR